MSMLLQWVVDALEVTNTEWHGLWMELMGIQLALDYLAELMYKYIKGRKGTPSKSGADVGAGEGPVSSVAGKLLSQRFRSKGLGEGPSAPRLMDKGEGKEAEEETPHEG